MKLYITTHPELLLIYFQTRSKFAKSELELLIQNSIEMHENIHVFPNDCMDFLEEFFDSKQLLEHFQCFFVEMSDSQRSMMNGEEGKDDNFDDKYKSLLSHFPKTIVGLHNSKVTEDINYSINVDRYHECLKTKLYLGLTTNRNYNTSFAELSNEEDIINIIEYAISFQKIVAKVIIIERYANGNHPFFRCINAKNIPVEYYVRNVDLSTRNAVSSLFNNFTLFTTSNDQLIHERAVLADSVGLIFDDDFTFIGRRNTWSLKIVYSDEVVSSYTQKCSMFMRSLFQ